MKNPPFYIHTMMKTDDSHASLQLCLSHRVYHTVRALNSLSKIIMA